MKSDSRFCAILPFIALALLGSCRESPIASVITWHQRFHWKAEDYFDDPKVIDLCRTIEANDLKEMERLIAAGADVNAKGKDNMTPLLWAYPDNKVERFTHLLKHGANPNIVIESDFNSHGGMRPGDSVTHMACKTAFPGYFEAVFEHGGDPNLVKNGIISSETPIFAVIKGSSTNKNAKIQTLVDKGADVNHMNGAWSTPVMTAISHGRQYDLALLLLKAGADHTVHKPKSNTRLVHIIVGQEPLQETWTQQQRNDYKKLVEWLVNHGESIDDARADLKRWRSWSKST